MKTPVTRAKLGQHFAYNWWKYLLLVVAAVFGWNLIFTMTAPRTPENLKLEVYSYSFGDQDTASAWLESVRAEEFPDQETISMVLLMPDEQYGVMTLSTRVFAGEGDLYIMPRSQFQNYAGMELFVPLEADAEITAMCEEAGADVSRGWRRNLETRERHLYGIPVKVLDPLNRWIFSSEDLYIGVRANCGNDENAMKLFKIILREMLVRPDAVPTDAATATDLS